MNAHEMQRRLERLENRPVEEAPDAVVMHADEYPDLDGVRLAPAEARELERQIGGQFIRVFVRDEPPEKR